jgi:hypothetical protein
MNDYPIDFDEHIADGIRVRIIEYHDAVDLERCKVPGEIVFRNTFGADNRFLFIAYKRGVTKPTPDDLPNIYATIKALTYLADDLEAQVELAAVPKPTVADLTVVFSTISTLKDRVEALESEMTSAQAVAEKLASMLKIALGDPTGGR